MKVTHAKALSDAHAELRTMSERIRALTKETKAAAVVIDGLGRRLQDAKHTITTLRAEAALTKE